MTDFRQRILTGKCAVGSWINSRSTVVAEIMAACGFDFLTIDAEHSAVDVSEVQNLLQAVSAGNSDCYPMVRLPGNDYQSTKRFLDAGAKGVIAPLINSASQAREVVSAVKYPPMGARGLGFSRSNMYGLNLDQELSDANQQTFVCVQIEHIEGVENIDDILSVPGVDAVLIGPYDLSASMGIPGEFEKSTMKNARQKVLAACAAKNIIAGIHVVQPDVQELIKRYQEGYRLLAFSLDITVLATIFQRRLGQFRDLVQNQG